MTPLTLRPGCERRVRAGHRWVFSNEIAGDVAALPPGGAVELRDARGRFIGRGYANPASLIAVRLLTRDPAEHPDEPALIHRALAGALRLRERLLPGRSAYRLCAGDADGLPGLVIDRYGPWLSVQVTTLGMERRWEAVQAALTALLAPTGVVRRDDAAARALEGLPRGEAHVAWGEVPARVPFEEAGLRLVADLLYGQKTGYYFDQAENRAFARRVCGGLRVLDLYANSGAWALYALQGGAREAVVVDSSAAACTLVQENAERNGLQVDVRRADARELLDQLHRAGERFGAVFVDPPAFAKTRKAAGAALKAYRDLNQQALAVLPEGGLLFSSSCSHHIQEDRFLEELAEAGRRAGRALRLVRRGEQAPDHPVDPNMPETRYLKHLVFEVGR